MSSPAGFLEKLLGQASEGASSYLKYQSPENQRRLAVLRRLDDLKIKGEEVAQNAASDKAIQEHLNLMRSRADIFAGGDTGVQLTGPPNPDPYAAAEEAANRQTPQVPPEQLGGAPGDEGLSKAMAGAAREKSVESRIDKALGRQQKIQQTRLLSGKADNPSGVKYVTPTPEARQQIKKLSGVDLPETGPIEQDVFDRIVSIINSKAKEQDPTNRYGALQGVDLAGNLVFFDRMGNVMKHQEGYFKTPPNVPNAAQEELSGTTNALDNVHTVRSAIESGALGPLTGRIANFSIESLGGYGLAPETVRALTDMRRGTITEAFANGGKQLTPTEKVEFYALWPQPNDTVQTALEKLDRADQFLRQRRRNRINSLTPFQQQGVTSGVGGSAGTPKARQTEVLSPEEEAILRKHGLLQKP